MKKIIFLMALVITGCASLNSQNENKRFLDFLEVEFERALELNPESYTYLGIKKRYKELNNNTEEFAQQMQEERKQVLSKLMQFDPAKMNSENQLSFRLVKKGLEEQIEDFEWRMHGYIATQFFGFHSDLPAFLMNFHQVASEQDLKDYIARLGELKRVVREQIVNLQAQEQKGILPPRFVYNYVLESSQNIIKGIPFDKSDTPSPLYSDFVRKAESLKLSKSAFNTFDQEVRVVLTKNVRPAYLDFIAFFEKQQKRAKSDHGVWKLPRGNEYYKILVQRHTTTNMTPAQIHKLGLDNVARLQNEMRAILKEINYKGTLQSFFTKLRTEDQYYFANTPQGGEEYLALSRKYYADIQPKIPQYFRLMPKAGFEIRAVEKFRESSAGIAFYQGPSEDGKRPGVYYVNLRNMRDLPKHEAQVVLYHEGAPGHHFQIALAQEQKELPKFRRFNNYTAYSEGWGLYTERLTGEMDLFQDPLSRFGKLSLEMLRASRLVLDTGIHYKKWSRQQAIDYMKANVPGSVEDQKNEIERYFVYPGQATAYMVGMLKIVELREKAKAQLGDKFDIRDFHDVVLGNGAVPLSELEFLVDAYVAKKKI